MTKKGSGTRDHRSDPDPEGTSERFRVDRVFAPVRPSRTSSSSMPPIKRPTSPPPSRPLDSSAPLGTAPPPTAPADSEAELALRRQLSRLQHQLSDAQRELAHKDDELAAAVEKRLEIQEAYDVILEEQRETRRQLDEGIGDRARLAGVEQRLQEAVAAAEELRHQLERERTERGAIAVQLDEARAAFERARNQWREESSTIDEQHVAQLAQLEQQKRAALDAAEQTRKTAIERQREEHEAELEALRAAHERSLAALRGELEPTVVEARNLAEENARLASQIEAQAAEHQNLLAERIELHKWEMQQLQETHTAQLQAQARAQSSELARMSEEVLAANEAGQLIDRNAKLREQLWEQTVQALRDSQKKLQQELAAVSERIAQAEANERAADQRVESMLDELEHARLEARALRDQLDDAEREMREGALDRERFAAYLQEGFAMLGAAAPRAAPPRLDSDLGIPNEPEADEASVPVHVDERQRPTRSYAVVPDLEAELAAASKARADSIEEIDIEEIEAEPLPDPTRPGSPGADQL